MLWAPSPIIGDVAPVVALACKFWHVLSALPSQSYTITNNVAPVVALACKWIGMYSLPGLLGAIPSLTMLRLLSLSSASGLACTLCLAFSDSMNWRRTPRYVVNNQRGVEMGNIDSAALRCIVILGMRHY